MSPKRLNPEWTEQVAFFLARYFNGRPLGDTLGRKFRNDASTIVLEVPRYVKEEVLEKEFPHPRWKPLQEALIQHWGVYITGIITGDLSPVSGVENRINVIIGVLEPKEKAPKRYLYHLTSEEYLPSIKQHGLRSHRAGVYVLDSKALIEETLEGFTSDEAPWGDDEWVVLTIDSHLLGYPSQIYRDIEFIEAGPNGFYWIHGDVPPEAIIRVETLPRAGRDKSRVLEESPPESPYEHLEVPPRRRASSGRERLDTGRLPTSEEE